MKYVNHLQNLINILKKKKIKICIAESLTGGKVAYEFVKKKVPLRFLTFQLFVTVMIQKIYFLMLIIL